MEDQQSDSLLFRSGDLVPQRRSRRSSFASSNDSDDFSIWSDTGDLAEQLAEEEDPLQIQLQPLSSEGKGLKDQGGKSRKRVHYEKQADGDQDGEKEAILAAESTRPGFVKEDIVVPQPPPRRISRFEAFLAYIMAPRQADKARSRGFVGKPLL